MDDPATTPFSYDGRRYLVLHGHAAVPCALLVYDPPARVVTGQPHVEAFEDPQAAISRALELGLAPEATAEFWPAGMKLDEHGQLVDDPAYAPSDEPAPAPEPIEARLDVLERRLAQLEVR